MTNYKYQLRKSSRKEICPQCGKRRFVPYVLAEDNATIVDPRWGRCDRENSCGYWMKPDGNPVDMTPREPLPPAEPMWLDPVCSDINVQNSLKPYADWLVGEMRADMAFEDYRIRTAADGGCIFLQIDIHGVIRAGKIIRYKDGHRIKEGLPVRWLHKDRAYKQYVHGEALHQCYFGEHLLAERPDAHVMVVEAEKTALLMSAARPEYVWLATGGSCNLSNPDKAKALEGRSVTVVPDNGMILKWRKIALPRGWEVSNVCLPHRRYMDDGYDILDLYDHERRGGNEL